MESGISQIKDYIGKDFAKVPYLYSNLFSLKGANSNNELSISTLIEKMGGGKIGAVFLLYHTCLHFYTRQEVYNGQKLKEILSQNRVDVVMLPGNQKQLLAQFPTTTWRHVADYIVRHKKAMLLPDYSTFMISTEEEIRDVAKLMMTDRLYSDIYTQNELELQLKERWRMGFGKIFTYKAEGKIVGSIAITGENDKFVFNGCLIVSQRYRRRGIADVLVKACVSYAYERNKFVLCFLGVENEATLALHKKCDSPEIIGKIIKCQRIKG